MKRPANESSSTLDAAEMSTTEMSTAELLRRAARSRVPELPDPHLVWWRAEIARRLTERDPHSEIVHRSLRRSHLLIAAAGLLAVFVWLIHLAWNLPQMEESSWSIATVVFAGLFVVPFAALGAGLVLSRDG